MTREEAIKKLAIRTSPLTVFQSQVYETLGVVDEALAASSALKGASARR